MAQGMTADFSVHGADIGTGTAADAAEGFGKDRVPGQLQPAVVQEYDVEDFFTALA